MRHFITASELRNLLSVFQGLELSLRIAKKTGEGGSDFASTFSNGNVSIKNYYHESNQLLAVTQLSADKGGDKRDGAFCYLNHNSNISHSKLKL